MFLQKTGRLKRVGAVSLAFLFAAAIFSILFPTIALAREIVHFSGEEMLVQSDPGKFMLAGAENIVDSQRLPRYRGNGMVIAEKGSGGQLLRTPANSYFTLLNYTDAMGGG